MEKLTYGPTIGLYLGKPVYKTIESNGYKYIYDRVAQCDDDGCPLDQLQVNEVMIRPGLIYRLAS